MNLSTILIPGGVAIAGWALGMWQASTICEKQANDLMETYNRPSPMKNKGSDMILRNQAASCFGLMIHIRLWLKPWLWGRPWNDFRRKWVGLGGETQPAEPRDPVGK